MYSLQAKLDFIKCLIAYMGNITRAVNDFNAKYTNADTPPLNRQTHYIWLKDDKILENGMTYRDYIDEIEMKTLEDAEFLLKNKAILEGNLRAISFYLKHRHPDYKQRFEVDTGDRKEADEAILKINKLFNEQFGNNNNSNGEPTGDNETNTKEQDSVSE